MELAMMLSTDPLLHLMLAVMFGLLLVVECRKNKNKKDKKCRNEKKGGKKKKGKKVIANSKIAKAMKHNPDGEDEDEDENVEKVPSGTQSKEKKAKGGKPMKAAAPTQPPPANNPKPNTKGGMVGTADPNYQTMAGMEQDVFDEDKGAAQPNPDGPKPPAEFGVAETADPNYQTLANVQQDVFGADKAAGGANNDPKAPSVGGSAELVIDPKELRFAPSGGLLKLNLKNNTGMRLAIKIKCSDNKIYRLNPVFMIVEKDGKSSVDVSRIDGTAKPDKLVLIYTEAASDASDAQLLFKAGNIPADKMTSISVPVFVN